MALDKTLSDIIKNGDKQTISNVITLLSVVKGDKNTISSISELLSECKSYQKSSPNSSQKPVRESVQTNVPAKIPTKPVQPIKPKDPTVDFAANLFEHSLTNNSSTGLLTVHSKNVPGMIKDSSSEFSNEELDMLSTFGNLI